MSRRALKEACSLLVAATGLALLLGSVSCRQLVGIDAQTRSNPSAGADQGVAQGGSGQGGSNVGVIVPEAAGAAGDLDTTEPECQSYCADVMEACQGELAVYVSVEQCLALCEGFEPGDPFNSAPHNTLACRAREADAAKYKPAQHCPSAGPGGAGVCGSDCDAYCQLFPQICPADFEYTSETDCLKGCQGLTDQDRFSAQDDHGGDTVECRLVHLAAAAVYPLEHCQHALVEPTEPWCTGPADAAPTCTEYCNIVLSACDGRYAEYESRQQCLNVCTALDPGTNSDKLNNSVGCRRFQAFRASVTPDARCFYAGPTGDGHCGDPGEPAEGHTGNCESYCRLVAVACPAEFRSTLVDPAQCMARCVQLDEAALDSKYTVADAKQSSGLQCRVLHTARAFEDPSECGAAVGALPCN
jgi:hypothetical protein